MRAGGDVPDDAISSPDMNNDSGAGVVCLTSLDTDTELINTEIWVNSMKRRNVVWE